MMTVIDDGGSTIRVTLAGENWSGKTLMGDSFIVPDSTQP
jgi:hypothetical protein